MNVNILALLCSSELGATEACHPGGVRAGAGGRAPKPKHSSIPVMEEHGPGGLRAWEGRFPARMARALLGWWAVKEAPGETLEAHPLLQTML